MIMPVRNQGCSMCVLGRCTGIGGEIMPCDASWLADSSLIRCS